jgi:hypothetical protein
MASQPIPQAGRFGLIARFPQRLPEGFHTAFTLSNIDQ